MTRVPLDVAASIAEVKPATIRVWVARGILHPNSRGYDLKELVDFLAKRHVGKARGAALAAHSRYQTRRDRSTLAS